MHSTFSLSRNRPRIEIVNKCCGETGLDRGVGHFTFERQPKNLCRFEVAWSPILGYCVPKQVIRKSNQGTFFSSRLEREQSPRFGLHGNSFSGLGFRFACSDLPFMHLPFANLSAISSTSPSWLQQLARIRASKVSNTATNLLPFLLFSVTPRCSRASPRVHSL